MNFLLEYLELSVLFIQRPFFSSLWWPFDKSISRKYASLRRCHCGKISCPVFVCVQFGSISLFPEACGTFSEFHNLLILFGEKSFNGKKTSRSCLIVLPSKRRRYIGCMPYSGLSTRENCLAKFIFVFLFGFLKDKGKQDGLRTLIEKYIIIQNNLASHVLKMTRWALVFESKFSYISWALPSK